MTYLMQEEGGCGIGVEEDIQKEKKKEEEENWEGKYTLGSATEKKEDGRSRV